MFHEYQTLPCIRMYFSASALFGINVDLDFLQSPLSFYIELSVLYKKVASSYNIDVNLHFSTTKING